MAMFEFQPRESQQVAQKPLSSKITVDSDGSIKTNISVEDIPTIESDPRYEMLRPAVAAFRASFQKSVEIDNAAKQARIQELKARMTEAAQTSTEAEIDYAEARAEGNEDRKSFFGWVGKTPKQNLTQAQQRVLEIQRLMDSETPEFSAPLDGQPSTPASSPARAASPVQAPVAQPAPAQSPVTMPTAQAPQPLDSEKVRVRDPRGRLGEYPKAKWQENSRQLMQQGYVLLP
jgi:hypothetical protein